MAIIKGDIVHINAAARKVELLVTGVSEDGRASLAYVGAFSGMDSMFPLSALTFVRKATQAEKLSTDTKWTRWD